VSEAWTVVAAVGLGTVVLKGAGPAILGVRELPARLTSVIELLAPALLAALVAVQVFGDGRSLVLDERVIGLLAAAVALWRKAPLLVVVAVAAAATAIVRALV
jgi:branched-subunit amino acid transport protein